MDVDGADGHDALSVALGEFAQQEADEGVQLRDLGVGVGGGAAVLRLCQDCSEYFSLWEPD